MKKRRFAKSKQKEFRRANSNKKSRPRHERTGSDCKAIVLLGGAFFDLTNSSSSNYGFAFVTVVAGLAAWAPELQTAFDGPVLIVYVPDGSVITL